MCLSVLAMSAAIKPHLGHYQRPVSREVMKASYVCFKPLLGLKVDIERDQIHKRQFEIFSRGIVHIRDQPFWIFSPCRPVKTFQVSLGATTAMPAYYSCGYLVSDNVA